ncbi:Hachiman antiphage defense system protein HamA [Kangiella shandongensis]|uniref:Hachiman antiphage defense system protein HamA n=1 Tax=Kangiella shandongensis TaxID=2763258 RepID=UPI001CC0E07E|nr:Hachiman antiphage defense system protein HamA [Kangiella shandongensis]
MEKVFKEKEEIEDGINNWYILDAQIDLGDENDAFIKACVDRINSASGLEVIDELLEGDDINFDMENLRETLVKAVLPEDNPNQKPQLRVTRNEFGEIAAQVVLDHCTDISFPFATHSLKENPDQPKLGLDGYGLVDLNNEKKLVIVEVKTSEDKNYPPAVAKSLLSDCRNALGGKGIRKLTTTLVAMYRQYQSNDELKQLLTNWIRGLHSEPESVVERICPVLIRGKVTARKEDLEGFMGSNQDYSPNGSDGVSCSMNGYEIEQLCQLAYEKVSKK